MCFLRVVAFHWEFQALAQGRAACGTLKKEAVSRGRSEIGEISHYLVLRGRGFRPSRYLAVDYALANGLPPLRQSRRVEL